MYRITYGDSILFDPYGDLYEIVSDASLSSEVNASAYLDFTVHRTHPLYNTIRERSDVVTLYWDANVLFEGVIDTIDVNIQGDKAVSCVSALDYLNDTHVRPYSTVAGEADLTAPSSVDGYFQWLIDQHNEHVIDSDKRFDVDINQGANLQQNNFIYRSSSSNPTTASELSSQILDSLGGYLTMRYEDGRKVLDLYADLHTMNTQIVDFGVNITDFSKTISTESIYNALMAKGGSPEFQNGDFESNDWNHWAVHPVTPFVNSPTHGGNVATYFVSGTGEYINDSFFYSRPGRRYKATVYVKNDRGSNVTIRGSYQYEQAGKWTTVNVNSSLAVENKDDQWVEFSFDFQPSLSDYTKIRPRWYFDNVGNDNNRRVYLDDFSFSQIEGDTDVSEDPIDLKQVPDGVTKYDSDMTKTDDVIYSLSAVERYGYKETVFEDSTITDVDDLMQAAIKELNKSKDPQITLDIKAVDLALFMEGYTHLNVGDAVRVRSAIHDTDEFLMVNSITLDLQDPGQSEYVIGKAYDSLTGRQSGYLRSLNSGINASLDQVASLDQASKDQAIQLGKVEDVANDAADKADQAQNTANDASDKADQAQNAADNAQQTADEAKDKADQNEIAISEEEQKRIELEKKTDSMIENVNSFQQQTNESFEAVNKAVNTITDQANAVSERAEEIAGMLDDANAVIDRHEDEIGSLTTTITNTTSRLDTVETSVGNAQDAADKAQQTADEAKEQILTVSTEFSQTAEEIRATAESAYSSANEALTQSSEAIQTANSIRTTLEQNYSTTDELEQTFASKSEVEQTATSIKTEVSQTYATKSSLDALQNIADSAIQTWTGNGIPTLSKPPASDWTTTELKQQHSGDLYYDNETGYAFRFGSPDSVNFTWARIADSDITKALADAAKAQQTAEGAIDEVEQLKIDIPGTYATKTEVTQTADSIRSEVSAKYTTKETFNRLSGTSRNYITNPQFKTGNVDNVANTHMNATDSNPGVLPGTATTFGKNFSGYDNRAENVKIKFIKGHTYRIEIDARLASDNAYTGNGGLGLFFWFMAADNPGLSKNQYTGYNSNLIPHGTKEWTHASYDYTPTMGDNDPRIVFRPAYRVAPGSRWLVTNFNCYDITDIENASLLAQSALDKSTTVEQDLDGFRTTVSETYTTKTEFDNLEIGGTNLAERTGDLPGSAIRIIDSSGNASTGTDDSVPSGQYVAVAFDSTSENSNFYIHSAALGGVFSKIRQGEQFTVSCWMKLSSVSGIEDKNFFIHCEPMYDIQYHRGPVSTSWTRCWLTGTRNGNTTSGISITFYPHTAYGSGKTVYVSSIKVERGNKPTAWSPAPEDIDESFADLADIVNSNNANVVSLMESSINQAKDSITTQVAASYYTKTEAEELMAQMSTQFQQTENSFEMQFNSLRAIVDQVNESADTNYSNIQKYIRFVDGHIIIGVEGNPFSLDIGNDRISFMQNNSEIAYISNHEFYITSGIITQNLRIGDFEFRPRSNGNLSLSLAVKNLLDGAKWVDNRRLDPGGATIVDNGMCFADKFAIAYGTYKLVWEGSLANEEYVYVSGFSSSGSYVNRPFTLISGPTATTSVTFTIPSTMAKIAVNLPMSKKATAMLRAVI